MLRGALRKLTILTDVRTERRTAAVTCGGRLAPKTLLNERFYSVCCVLLSEPCCCRSQLVLLTEKRIASLPAYPQSPEGEGEGEGGGRRVGGRRDVTESEKPAPLPSSLFLPPILSHSILPPTCSLSLLLSLSLTHYSHLSISLIYDVFGCCGGRGLGCMV